jgi:hypothetical protein
MFVSFLWTYNSLPRHLLLRAQVPPLQRQTAIRAFAAISDTNSEVQDEPFNAIQTRSKYRAHSE